MASIYDLPTAVLYIAFVILVVVIAVVGLAIFRNFDLGGVKCSENNGIIGIFIGIMASFLGITMSFLIITSWDMFKTARNDNQKEAQTIYILYENIETLPGTEDTRRVIEEYLEYIINEEFPQMKEGGDPERGQLYIQDIQRMLYNYVPETPQQTILYQQSLELINVIINYRVNRILTMQGGLNSLVWWVAIIDATLIIIMSWLLTCANAFHYVLVVVLSIYISSALFTIQVLSNPFRGQSGLTAEPFEATLRDININI